MKSSTLLVVLALALIPFGAQAENAPIKDPVKDYVGPFYSEGGDDNIYADDKVLLLEMDVFNDGHTEALLSMARNRNGRENVWSVYRKTDSNYVRIGGVGFNPSLFYVGPIDNTGKSGIVSFLPGGNGTGTLDAYVLTSGTIQELTLGQVTRDPTTRELKGEDLYDRYFGDNVPKGSVKDESSVKEIAADELGKKYNAKVQKKAYRDAVLEEWKKNVQTTGSKN